MVSHVKIHVTVCRYVWPCRREMHVWGEKYIAVCKEYSLVERVILREDCKMKYKGKLPSESMCFLIFPSDRKSLALREIRIFPKPLSHSWICLNNLVLTEDARPAAVSHIQ